VFLVDYVSYGNAVWAKLVGFELYDKLGLPEGFHLGHVRLCLCECLAGRYIEFDEDGFVVVVGENEFAFVEGSDKHAPEVQLIGFDVDMCEFVGGEFLREFDELFQGHPGSGGRQLLLPLCETPSVLVVVEEEGRCEHFYVEFLLTEYAGVAGASEGLIGAAGDGRLGTLRFFVVELGCAVEHLGEIVA
jgi:hypothetical protein